MSKQIVDFKPIITEETKNSSVKVESLQFTNTEVKCFSPRRSIVPSLCMGSPTMKISIGYGGDKTSFSETNHVFTPFTAFDNRSTSAESMSHSSSSRPMTPRLPCEETTSNIDS